jgi:hypothetical protein
MMLGALDGTAPATLVESDSRAQYVEPGYLLYVRESTLVAQPFNPRTAKLTGDPRPLADKVDASNVGQADFSASRDGTLIYRALTTEVRQLLWRDRAGRELGTVGEGTGLGGERVRRVAPAVDNYDVQPTSATFDHD